MSMRPDPDARAIEFFRNTQALPEPVHPAPEFAHLVGRFPTDADGRLVQDPPPSQFKIQPREVEVLEPLDDRVVVRPDGAAEMIGGMYVPDMAQERPSRGTVVAVGPKVLDLEEGAKVLYGHFTGTEAWHMGEEVLMMRRADIYCRIRTVTV